MGLKNVLGLQNDGVKIPGLNEGISGWALGLAGLTVTVTRAAMLSRPGSDQPPSINIPQESQHKHGQN